MWMSPVCRAHFLSGLKTLSDLLLQPESHVTIPESSESLLRMLPQTRVMHMRMSPEVILLLKINILLASKRDGHFWLLLPVCGILTPSLLVTKLSINFCPNVDPVMELTPFS